MQSKVSIIQEVPEESLPRERLLAFGEKALANHELLAILLRTGYRDTNVLGLAMQVLSSFENLAQLKLASLVELQAIKGIGQAKAIELRAAIELGSRIAQSTLPKLGQLTSTEEAGQWLLKEMRDLHQEHLVVLFLNSKNEIIRKRTIFMGTVNSACAHPREIFKEAVKYPTARIIMAHNHPSGDTTPSGADLNFTERMIECGDLMGIEILDHLIIGDHSYRSLREEEGLFE
ncbi:RadC family protein [Vaginisenegalia massiliensis]|uniref:RadC family protein n=1 Tax=Vaginisenegalia massiliensis TaxID=2058294 RepID=UPI000F541FA7|nr:DNA repair protein RadC [Vaginisenegalia massiliensis]